jgi:putative ABC transport system permease protein
MNPIKVVQLAWRGLTKNKLRSLLTMLGVIIGVAAVIVMIAVSAGTEATIAEQVQGLGTNLIFVQAQFGRDRPPGPGGSQSGGLVYSDALAIAQDVQGVDGVVVEQDSDQTVKAGDVSVDQVPLLGTTPDFPMVRDLEIAEGRFFTQEELDHKDKIVILGSSIAKQLFGDASPVGQVVMAGNTPLTVIGVFKPKGVVGSTDYDARLYLPIKVVFQKFTPSQFARIIGDRVRLIYVKAVDGANLADVQLQINLLLANRHKVDPQNPDFVMRTQQDIISTQEATTAAFRNLLAWVAAVSLVVGGIGIMNIMLVSVTERTREIGIRQSVGASPNDIRWQFLAEALLLSLVGGILGVVVGVGGAWLFGKVGGMRTVIVPSSIILAFSSAAAVGIFFGFYPASKAAQLDPIQALRYE